MTDLSSPLTPETAIRHLLDGEAAELHTVLTQLALKTPGVCYRSADIDETMRLGPFVLATHGARALEPDCSAEISLHGLSEGGRPYGDWEVVITRRAGGDLLVDPDHLPMALRAARDVLAALPEAELSPHLGVLIDHLPRSIHCADDSKVRPFDYCFADGTPMSPLGQGALMFCRALKTRLQPGVSWSTTYHSVNFGGLAPSRWEVFVSRLSGE